MSEQGTGSYREAPGCTDWRDNPEAVRLVLEIVADVVLDASAYDSHPVMFELWGELKAATEGEAALTEYRRTAGIPE